MMSGMPYVTGQRAERPWGTWLVEAVFPCSVLKRILVYPGKRISLQRHLYRSEHWVVAQGVASVQVDDYTCTLHVGESICIPVRAVHRLANDGEEPLQVMELQYGEQLREDDIERFADDFGRVVAG